MDGFLKSSLLKSIELSGSVENESSEVKILINKNLDNILDSGSGKVRLRPVWASKFNLILSQPGELLALSPFEIRCLHCKRVISYPAWNLRLKFDRSIMMYFLCFSEVSPLIAKLDCRG